MIQNLKKFLTELSESVGTKMVKKAEKKAGYPLLGGQIRQLKSAIQFTEHFGDRMVQRFEEDEQSALSTVVFKAINKLTPCNVAQKYIDDNGMVVVMERAGIQGAILVTAYKIGQEMLLSDAELAKLKQAKEI